MEKRKRSFNAKHSKNFRRAIRTEDSRFIIITGFKVSFIALFVTLLVSYIIWLMMSMNNIFFEANGFFNISELRQAYFDFILKKIIFNLPYFLSFFILLFFMGMYVGWILLRPFQEIGKYCENVIEDSRLSYSPDLFSDFKLLTRFGSFFFQYLKDAEKKNSLQEGTIPPQFTKFHGPVFDKVFFFHFMLFIVMILITASYVILFATVEIHEGIIDLAIQTLQANGKSMGYFLKNQIYIFESVQIMTVVVLTLSYMILAVNLYSKVSGAVFAFFSTMRSFIKGNFHARVHLIGYGYLRPQGRMVNKYLDHVTKKLMAK